MPHPTVASLHVYPVKGCRGIDVEAAYFERTGKLAERCMLYTYLCNKYNCCSGLAYDRHWMVVQQSKGKVATQRQKPRSVLQSHKLSLGYELNDSCSAVGWHWSRQAFRKKLWNRPASLRQKELS